MASRFGHVIPKGFAAMAKGSEHMEGLFLLPSVPEGMSM